MHAHTRLDLTSCHGNVMCSQLPINTIYQLVKALHNYYMYDEKNISGKRVNFIGQVQVCQRYTQAEKISLLMLSLETINKHICTCMYVALCMCVCVCTHLFVTIPVRSKTSSPLQSTNLAEWDINERADHSITSLSAWMVIIRGHNLITPWTQDMHGTVWIVIIRGII